MWHCVARQFAVGLGTAATVNGGDAVATIGKLDVLDGDGVADVAAEDFAAVLYLGIVELYGIAILVDYEN